MYVAHDCSPGPKMSMSLTTLEVAYLSAVCCTLLVDPADATAVDLSGQK